MTESNQFSAEQAIQKAYQALKEGDTQSARRWAEHAIQLTPGWEEPWLVMAATAKPQESIAYLKQALKINPGSPRARQGMQWAERRLAEQDRSASRSQSTRPRIKTTPKARQVHSGRRLVLTLLVLGLMIVLLAIWIAWPRIGLPAIAIPFFDFHSSSNTESAGAEAHIAKPSYTPSPTATFTPSPTPPPSFTPTALPTSLPTQPAAVDSSGGPTSLTTYVVQPGDTLSKIAKLFSVDQNALVTVNNIVDPSRITAGQRLLIPQPGSAPASASPVYSGNKLIVVDISEQHLYAYEADTLVFSFIASTGMNNATRVGSFSVLNKIPNAYGSTWNIWMPNWLGIYWAGSLQNGIHALPILSSGATLWEGYLGRPISYGCIVLGTHEAQLLYNWSEIGVPVEIRW